jgi:DNA-directed RNA polymerase subunit N (RpoN/RPB10)
VPAAPVPTVTLPQQNVAVVPLTTPATGDPVQDSLQSQLDTLNNQIRADDASAAVTDAAAPFDDLRAGALLDALGLHRMCCRRHLLTHVDIIDVT